jgi:FAD/FMN-containing dehydrogenase
VAVPPPSACAPMAAVKRALDPENRLSPGRFRPWW